MDADGARFSGVLCPVVTPFRDDLEPDAGRFVEHCRRLLAEGADLAPFGTTGEGNSLSVPEKTALLDELVDAGIEPGRLMPGTGSPALDDAVTLTRHAVGLGCRGVLLLPPFYYKDVGDDGLYRYVAEIVERTADERLRVYLYHIPPVAVVGFGAALIERLVRDFPRAVAGIKDSSGDWSNTEALHVRGWDDFRIFVGSETFLLANMRAGGAGCISATANVNAAAIRDLYDDWQAADAAARQQALTDLRGIVQAMPMIPALKAITAHRERDPTWLNVRPPLTPLDPGGREALLRAWPASVTDSRVPRTPGGGNSR